MIQKINQTTSPKITVDSSLNQSGKQSYDLASISGNKNTEVLFMVNFPSTDLVYGTVTLKLMVTGLTADTTFQLYKLKDKVTLTEPTAPSGISVNDTLIDSRSVLPNQEKVNIIEFELVSGSILDTMYFKITNNSTNTITIHNPKKTTNLTICEATGYNRFGEEYPWEYYNHQFGSNMGRVNLFNGDLLINMMDLENGGDILTNIGLAYKGRMSYKKPENGGWGQCFEIFTDYKFQRICSNKIVTIKVTDYRNITKIYKKTTASALTSKYGFDYSNYSRPLKELPINQQVTNELLFYENSDDKSYLVIEEDAKNSIYSVSLVNKHFMSYTFIGEYLYYGDYEDDHTYESYLLYKVSSPHKSSGGSAIKVTEGQTPDAHFQRTIISGKEKTIINFNSGSYLTGILKYEGDKLTSNCTYIYDGGALIRIQDNIKNKAIQYSYDNTRVSNIKGITILDEIDTVDHCLTFDYLEGGTKITNEEGKSILYYFDVFQRKIAFLDYDGKLTTYTYENNHNVCSVSNPILLFGDSISDESNLIKNGYFNKKTANGMEDWTASDSSMVIGGSIPPHLFTQEYSVTLF